MNSPPPDRESAARLAFDALFGRSRPGALVPYSPDHKGTVGAFDVSQRDNFLPGMLEYCFGRELFITHNTFRRTALKAGAILPDHFDPQALWSGPKYNSLSRKNEGVFELANDTHDLDVGRDNTQWTAAQALALVDLLAYDGKQIPIPSMTAYSGRGAYVLWFLREPESERPPEKTPETLDLWWRVHRAIDNKIRQFEPGLNPDPQSFVYSQWYKAPGAYNENGDAYCIYRPTIIQDAQGFRYLTYTLPELMDFFGLSSAAIVHPALIKQGRAALPSKGPAHKIEIKPRDYSVIKTKRAAAPYRMRAQEIERIAEHRRRILEGERNHFILFYYSAVAAWYLYGGAISGAQVALDQARAKAWEFNLRFCDPPLNPGRGRDGFENCVHNKRGKQARSDTVARKLAITADESRHFELYNLVPLEISAARLSEKIRRRVHNVERRELADLLLNQGGTPESIGGELVRKGYYGDVGAARKYVYSRREQLRDQRKYHPARALELFPDLSDQGTISDPITTPEQAAPPEPITAKPEPAPGPLTPKLCELVDIALAAGWTLDKILAHTTIKAAGITRDQVEQRISGNCPIKPELVP